MRTEALVPCMGMSRDKDKVRPFVEVGHTATFPAEVSPLLSLISRLALTRTSALFRLPRSTEQGAEKVAEGRRSKVGSSLAGSKATRGRLNMAIEEHRRQAAGSMASVGHHIKTGGDRTLGRGNVEHRDSQFKELGAR
jgi:hypothetical protein